MSMFTAFNISASGMTAQQLRTDVISQNIANANTTRTSDGTPYVKKSVVFTERHSPQHRQGLELLYIHLDTGEVQEHLLML